MLEAFMSWATLLDLMVITGLGGISALLLVLARKRYVSDEDTLVTEINQLLPQTQCAQCGYPGCKPYAEAIAQGEAINRCPPGGEATIHALGNLLGRPVSRLDPECGEEALLHVVSIKEDECIGCTLCLPACPVDAIIGAAGVMHTVITSHCTGCDLCIEPCPVDCISVTPIPQEQAQPVHPVHDQPCINCGFCAAACPRALQPQLLYLHRLDINKSDSLRLDACIECRLCDASCPSEIPLTKNFQVTKTLKNIAQRAKDEAAQAEKRYLVHTNREASKSKKVVARPSAHDRAQLLAAIKQHD